MISVLLVPDLPMERWPSMDRYASRLALHLQRNVPDVRVNLAGEIAGLTVEEQPARVRISSPSGLPLLPAPGLSEIRRYVSRYAVYPWRVHARPGEVLHVLDHSYAHLLLRKRRRPAVVTVHDLLPVITVRRKERTLRGRLRRWLLSRVLEGLRRADHWIVATEWLRGELATWLGHDDRISVVPYGVDEAFFATADAAKGERRVAARQPFGLPPDAFVVLHVGSVGPRKNIPTLIAAVDGLRRTGVNAWLLQVGGGELTREQRDDIRQRGLTPYVAAVGEAQEADLRRAYQAADVLLFPSHYEGFGFPVLEAMASGTPVVTSGAGGLAEVAGDAAVVVGGRETEPYVTALRRLAQSADWREQLAARGRERAKQFRWLETARKTAAVYRRVRGER